MDYQFELLIYCSTPHLTQINFQITVTVKDFTSFMLKSTQMDNLCSRHKSRLSVQAPRVRFVLLYEILEALGAQFG